MEMNGTTVIARPIEEVFAYVINVSKDAHWRTGVTESGWKSGQSLSPGAIGYTRAGDAEVDWRVISIVAGESVDWELISGPIKGRGGYRLVPVDSDTQFTLVADVEPSGMYKLLGPLFAWIGRRQNQADAEKLRGILESQ
jgi:hypothetical protein